MIKKEILPKQISFEERAGAFLTVAAATGNMELLKYMSLLFPTVRGERHHENALMAAQEAGQIEAAEALMEIGVQQGVAPPYVAATLG